MSSNTYIERNRLELLQTEYRRSWHNFTVAVEDLQAIMTDPGAAGEIVADARTRVEEAVLEYREARDILAECLLDDAPQEPVDSFSKSQAA